ncbi:endonuclease G, mitochondrial [Drosophila innubila]|uniref:endonuclease G, mitochondrial n=1 Tax=Drosophila innubila TaxID=198719 RepID=UPI00148D09CB|nr:endonuclease G, mitochondrial [Drosophila innubila]
MQSYTLPITVGILTGLVGFVMGALLQQDASYRGIQTAMASDPYIYQSRQQIYGALRLVGQQRTVPLSGEDLNDEETPNDESAVNAIQSSGDHSCESQSTEDSVFANYVRWFQTNMQAVTMFFTFSLGDEPLLENEPATHVATLMKYGFPGLDDIHVYRNFVLSYDRRNRIAHWVCEHLNGDSLASDEVNVEQNLLEFNVDSSIPLMFRATPRDYRNTDWVAGHMASPQNYKCDELDYIETYLMSNIAPLSRGLKTNIWAQLEKYVRELAVKCGSVYVYTGPLFMPQRITFRNWAIRHQVIGMNTVAVPTHFFKVIIAEGKNNKQYPYVEGYVVPNVDLDKNIDLSSFLSDIRDIEHFAGLKFFDGIRGPHFHNNN